MSLCVQARSIAASHQNESLARAESGCGYQGPSQSPRPMITTDPTITVRSIVSQVGMRLSLRCGMCLSLRALHSVRRARKGL